MAFEGGYTDGEPSDLGRFRLPPYHVRLRRLKRRCRDEGWVAGFNLGVMVGASLVLGLFALMWFMRK